MIKLLIKLLNSARFTTTFSSWEGIPNHVVEVNLKIAVIHSRFPLIMERVIDRGYIFIRGEKIILCEINSKEFPELKQYSFKMISFFPMKIGFHRCALDLQHDIEKRLCIEYKLLTGD